MARAGTIQKVTTNVPAALAKPTWLADAPVKGMEEARKYVVFPRMKVVQKAAATELLATFSPGDFILMPNMTPIAIREAKGMDPGPPVYFTPLYFYPEWVTWNPIKLKGQEPAIAYRTRDPNDPIVAKSRSRQLRTEPIRNPDGSPRMAGDQQLTQRHVEHLNWIVLPYGLDGVQDPFIVSFAKGEHFSGSKFAGLVRQRNASPFFCRFQMRATFRPSRGQGDWWGIEVANPEDGSPWVDDEATAKKLEGLHDELRAADTGRVIRADMADMQEEIEAEAVEVGPNGQRDM